MSGVGAWSNRFREANNEAAADDDIRQRQCEAAEAGRAAVERTHTDGRA